MVFHYVKTKRFSIKICIPLKKKKKHIPAQLGKGQLVNSGTRCFVVLRFTALPKLKGYGNLLSSKSIGAIFPTAFAQFVSLSHFSNSCSISNFLIIIIISMGSVISDYDSPKAQMIQQFFDTKKHFLFKVRTLFF